MAFSAVRTSNSSSGTASSVAMTFGSATSAGNLVVVHIKIGGLTDACTSVTDDKGNTYAVITGPVVGALKSYQAYGVQVAGGVTTVTANFSGSVDAKRCGADEYAGGATSNAAIVDASKTGSGTGTAVLSATVTPAATGELFVSTLVSNAPENWTAGTGYTLLNGFNALTVRSQYKLSGGSSETGPASMGTSTDWATILTAFKPAGGAAATWAGYIAPFGWS